MLFLHEISPQSMVKYEGRGLWWHFKQQCSCRENIVFLLTQDLNTQQLKPFILLKDKTIQV